MSRFEWSREEFHDWATESLIKPPINGTRVECLVAGISPGRSIDNRQSFNRQSSIRAAAGMRYRVGVCGCHGTRLRQSDNSGGLQNAVCLLLFALSACPATSAEPAPVVSPFSSAEAKAHQQAWAKRLGLPVQVTNSVGMKLSLVPPGQFVMGSPPKEEWHRDDEILHRVTLTKAFYMAATEVTQGQWKALMGKNPSFFTGDALPVETVTWEQAAEFCRRLSKKEGKRYRLATEAEWEYACRAGTTAQFRHLLL